MFALREPDDALATDAYRASLEAKKNDMSLLETFWPILPPKERACCVALCCLFCRFGRSGNVCAMLLI